MYHSSVIQRSPTEEDDRLRRDSMAGPAVQQIPPYNTRSPSQSHFHSFSPKNGNPPSSTYNTYPSRPSSSTAVQMSPVVSQSPRLGPPPSPTNGLSHLNRSAYPTREAGTSTFYDPTSEHREGSTSWNQSPYSARSPVQSRDSVPYFEQNPEARHRRNSHHSPTSARFPHQSPTFHAHPSSRHNSITQSPVHNNAITSLHSQHSSSYHPSLNGTSDRTMTSDVSISACQPAKINEVAKPVRADPMAFSSILSSTTVDPPRSSATSEPPYKHKGQSLKTPNGDASAGVGMTASTVVTPTNTSPRKSLLKSPPPQDHEPLPRDQVKEHPKSKGSKNILSAKLVSTTSDKENESVQQALAEINAKELSDVDAPGWTNEKEKYRQVSQKRQLRVGENEASRRKRRRTTNTTRVSTQMNTFVKQGREGFKHFNEDAAVAEVQQKEILDEKERKKDMQRKRRREKTIQNETQKQREAIERAQLATDNAVREKLLKEAHKAEKKAKSTKRILDTGDLSESIREVTPLALNLEGGTMSTFQTSSQISPEPPRKRAKGPAIRPKKSKEKKQAEIQAAEQGYALEQMERENPVLIAPKEENRRETLMRETKESRAHKDTLSAPTVTNYASKGYQQIYDQIWKDIARKDIPKVFRIKENSLATKQSNMRKTAQLAAKEARRWQLRTNKSTKDVQARAKRSMREMMGFWKRNEREERDMRRIAEKQELDNAKKAEADREANRQRRKLNFLISQTELYSHFVGNKVKTDDIERSTDSPDVVTSRQIVAPGKPEPRAIALPGRVGQAGTKVMNFEDLDFDAEDETELENAAAANAQIALQEAQDKARAFNGDTNALQAQFDDSDMNFMEPTSLGAIDVQQPAMLNAQLKEYQLKGLKWLVNLYEQGINGILADEMGLGKTVQSISVMAYLAEKHNIWGPFLVIAPASTLHNWQQEISRFVPSLTVLPYWGTAKDRKVLRKDWDRKHITYTKESKFHVLVTSYQLVVMDTQYFQKIKWQYMILDEAQAIKSSSSSRWKSLLGFQCRNRLLLTGTPIQNNMQELWALLHFIMPTLFDSHDEFSDWFSKDIESHAQSNTKLNEDQLKRLHMILKPFMLRRIKKNVQKELGDKIEVDVFCDLTYRQRAYYANLRNKISIMDLIEKAAVGDDQDTATLMNLVMQFRKVCNHPDLFERADTSSPLSMAYFAETASFMREGHNINVAYSTRNLIEYDLPRLLCSPEARLEIAGPGNEKAGFKKRYLRQLMNIWTPEYIQQTSSENQAFSWLRFADTSAGEAYEASHNEIFMRAMQLTKKSAHLEHCKVMYHGSEDAEFTPVHALFNIVERSRPEPLANTTNDGLMRNLLDVSRNYFEETGLRLVEPCARPAASAPPIEVVCSNQATGIDNSNVLFNVPIRKALYGFSEKDELALLEAKVDPNFFPIHSMLPAPMSESARFTNIQVPSMRRFVTDSGKLAKLDQLLRDLKNGDHRVLLYFQMTRMIDLMEEYLTYRGYKYLRLDGSTKLEDRRDTVSDFQTRNDIFIFLLSTRAGGLGINLTAADTVIFYDSDWNPTIDSQAMDRAHRLGQTRQVTVYRMITRGTIEERIRKRALQKEEVQRVVIAGGSGAGVDFNTRSKENRTKDIAMWLADDEQAELIEKKEKEVAEKVEEVKKGVKRKATGGRKKDVSLDDMYHEGEGHFDDGSNKPSGAATPIDAEAAVKGAKKGPGKGKGLSKKAKTAKQRLAIADAAGDLGMSGM